MYLIDSHCHIDAAAFDSDRDAVLARANTARIQAQVIPATHAAGWEKLGDICAHHDGLFPAYGLHPMFLDRHRPEHLSLLKQRIERERPRAIGECGLDFFVDQLDPDTQRHYFHGQLALAREFGLPVIVHARRAVEELIVTLRKFSPLRGVVHSFSGSAEQAAQLWKQGFLIGLGGPVTYPRANRLRRLVSDMPVEFLLLETDAPDQPDAGIRGQRNEPARLATILETIAQLRNEAPAELAEATSENARRLFSLPAPSGT